MSRACPALAILLLAIGPVASAEGLIVVADRKVPHAVPRTFSQVKIDGVLDEEAWETALVLELPFEVNPGENIPARVRTQAFLTYDDTHFYAAFRAGDPEPGAIRARLSDRDRAFDDDFVGVIVDTFNDERRAFEFFVNPLGIQMDLIQDDISRREDSSWDAIWDSAGKLTADGYEVEMAIPYTSLRFQRGAGEQIWSLDLIRIYPRDRRYLFSLNPRDRNVNCYLCQTSKIVGFEGAEPGANVEITPTLTAVRTDLVDEDDPDAGLQQGSADVEPGLFVSWGMTPNLTLTGTINPDFSQVEADAARLAVNEQFTLFFPEKRPFFLEGADDFRTEMNVVHTRQVAAPDWGVKVTGKEGKNGIGTFIAEDSQTNIIFPGVESSSSVLADSPTRDGVFRYRRDVGEASAVGGVVTARRGEDGYSNLVAGLDGTLRFTESDLLRYQLLGSRTRYPDEMAAEFEQPFGSFSDYALMVQYRHSTRNWATRVRYQDIGDGFRADLGFMPRVGFRQPLVSGSYTWWGDDQRGYSRISVGGDWDQLEDQNGNLIEREIEADFDFSGRKQSFFKLRPGHRTRVYEGVTFSQNFANTFFEVRPGSVVYVNFQLGYGDQIDFAYIPETPSDPAARQGTQLRGEVFLNLKLGRRVDLGLEHEYRKLDVEGGRAFDANLSQLRLVLQFTSRISFRAIFQHSDVRYDLAVYPQCDPASANLADCMEPEVRDFFSQLLFTYKVNPRTAVFVGYSDAQSAFQDTGMERTDRTFFLKLTYAWVL